MNKHSNDTEKVMARGFPTVKQNLVECIVCSRTFNEDRIRKHEVTCAKTSKPRKVFNPAAKRTEGRGNVFFGASTKTEKKKTGDPKWKRQHNELMSAIKISKKMQEMEK